MSRWSVVLIFILLPGLAMAFPWTRDMMNQPSIKPQEEYRDTPRRSVPVEGMGTLVRDRDASEFMVNPVEATAKSIAMGRALYRVYCAACHGNTGQGDGNVGKVFSVQPAVLTDDYVQELTDGWVWGTMTFGSYVMPKYANDLSPEERWHVINYIRHGLVDEAKAAASKDMSHSGTSSDSKH